jgi:uncharacterized membrane protein HdeD (DUF308 family)
MRNALQQLVTRVRNEFEKAKIGKGVLSTVAVIAVLQAYFVRELLAAELLFIFGFAVLFVLGGIAYLLGALGERGLDLAEAGVRVAGVSARRGYSAIEDISRKSFRHARSESAQ